MREKYAPESLRLLDLRAVIESVRYRR